MSDIADRFVVVLDANVLYPFRVRDALLRFAEAGLYRARWSREILREWRASLIRDKPKLEDSIASQEIAMARAFPEALVDGYEGLVQALSLPDPNDRHVLAVAIRSGAQHIVTENLKDFPADVLAQYDISAVTADQFLSSTFELYPMQAVAALRTMRDAYNDPVMTPGDFVLDLMRVGLARTASLCRENIDLL